MDVEDIALEGVDDPRAAGVGLFALVVPAVARVDMAVDHQGGAAGLEERVEAGIALVGEVRQVAVSLCRRVGHEDVHAAEAPEKGIGPMDAAAHGALRVHVRSRPILHAPAEAEDAQTAVDVHRPVDVLASLGRLLDIGLVMVPRHIQHRRVPHRHQELQIGGREVAAGDD